MADRSAPKRCPFCASSGSRLRIERTVVSSIAGKRSAHVRVLCTSCFAQGPVVTAEPDVHLDATSLAYVEAAAWTRWNGRGGRG